MLLVIHFTTSSKFSLLLCNYIKVPNPQQLTSEVACVSATNLKRQRTLSGNFFSDTGKYKIHSRVWKWRVKQLEPTRTSNQPKSTNTQKYDGYEIIQSQSVSSQLLKQFHNWVMGHSRVWTIVYYNLNGMLWEGSSNLIAPSPCSPEMPLTYFLKAQQREWSNCSLMTPRWVVCSAETEIAEIGKPVPLLGWS